MPDYDDLSESFDIFSQDQVLAQEVASSTFIVAYVRGKLKEMNILTRKPRKYVLTLTIGTLIISISSRILFIVILKNLLLFLYSGFGTS